VASVVLRVLMSKMFFSARVWGKIDVGSLHALKGSPAVWEKATREPMGHVDGFMTGICTLFNVRVSPSWLRISSTKKSVHRCV